MGGCQKAASFFLENLPMKWLAPLLFCFIPFGFLGGFYNPNMLAGWMLIFCALAYFFFELSKIKEPKVSALGVILGALPLVSVLLLWILHLNGGVAVYAPYVGFYLLLFLAFFIISNDEIFDVFGDVQLINRIFLILGLTLTILSLKIPGYTGLGLIVDGHRFDLPLYFGSFNQPNNFATGLASIVALSIWATLEHKKIDKFTIISWSIISAGIFLSASKVGLVCLIAIAIWLACFCLDRWTFRSLMIYGASLVVGFCVAIGLESLGVSLGRDFQASVASALGEIQGVREKSTDIRLSLLNASWIIGLDSPFFGHGFDQFRYLYSDVYSEGRVDGSVFPYYRGHGHPHNEIAYLWVSGGLFALFGILAPILWFVFRTCSKNLISLVVFIPLALHSNTEYPLYSASLQLITCLTALLFISRKYQAWRGGSQFLVKPSLHLFGVAVSLASAVVVADTLAVVHYSRVNSLEWAKSHTYESYLAVREDDRELEHWLYGETAQLVHKKNLAETAMATGLPEKVKIHLSDLKNIVRKYNKHGNWARLAAAYNGLGMRAHLIGFIDYIETLDSSYAQELRTYYRLPNPQ